MEGVAQFGIMQKARAYLREHVFTPHAILKILDMTGGVYNLCAYEVICTVEFLYRNPLKDNRKNYTILPREKKIRDASKKLNAYADSILPNVHHKT